MKKIPSFTIDHIRLLRGIYVSRQDEVNGEKAFKLINSLKYAHIATNIGDLRTLVIHPSSTIYLHSTKEEQEHAGVYEDTIRISVGIEDVEDLIADFTQAIENI